MADSVEPLDQKTMQRRELLALRLAVLTGNVDRARQAAERLFGLRLDADTQVQLAAQMHQLGMHELAEAVLGRARRRAGNKAAALVGLMLQYQRQNKTDVAVQVAHQILRRSTTRQFSPVLVQPRRGRRPERGDPGPGPLGQAQGDDRAARGPARRRAQLGPAPPDAGRLLQGRRRARTRPRRSYERIAELRPDDGKLRYQIAMQLLQLGRLRRARSTTSRPRSRKSPRCSPTSYWEIQHAFQQAGKLDELIRLVEEIDIKAVQQPVGGLAAHPDAPPGREDSAISGMTLFRKAWKAFPDQQDQLLSNIRDEEVWQVPEMYDSIREAVLPGAGRSRAGNWAGVDQISLWMGDGR